MIPSPTSPPLQQALACAKLAKIAYEPIVNVPGDVTPVAVGDDHGFVLRDNANGIAVIAIAGTDSLQDWWGNAKQNWKEVAARFSIDTDRALESVLGEHGLNLKLYLTGHSRGGAIAQHLARMYEKWHPTCITFGTPRSCNENITVDGISYVLPWDPVPQLPLWSGGNRDPAIRQYLFADFADDEDPISLWRACWNVASVAAIYAWEWRHFRWGSDNVAAWALRRHAMEHYVTALEAL